MFLPDVSIRRPVTATMLVMALVIFGLIGFSRLGVSLYPDIDNAQRILLRIVNVLCQQDRAGAGCKHRLR